MSRWGDLISATIFNLDQKKTVGAEGGDCTVHSMLKWFGRAWEKVWGAVFPSVLSSWLCWFRGMNCMKHYLKNLQEITLGHVDTVQSDICSNQLLRFFMLALPSSSWKCSPVSQFSAATFSAK